MKLSDERLAEFNNRMNDWISKQGLIFQLTHGGTGLGSRAPIFGSLIRAVASLLLLTVIAALSYGGFLFWKATGDELPKQFQKGIAKSLAVEEVTATGFKRDFKSGNYKQILVEGDNDTFFNHLDAREISFQMEPLSGLFGDWDARSLSIRELSAAIKAGEADAERASLSWQSFFTESPSFTYNNIEIGKCTLTWGYASAATWGSVVESKLTASRTPNGWGLKFQGGTFSQGIFRRFEIKELLVEVSKENGLTVNKAELSKDGGTFNWSGSMVTGGDQPQFEFEGQFSLLPASVFLPRGLLSTVNGTLSGDLVAKGSTNSSDGIGFEMTARPEGPEGLYLTKEITVLRMLSHLDPQRSYRKVPFTQGSFRLETKGQLITVSDLDLVSKDETSAQVVARLKGQFIARPASRDELIEISPLLDQANGTTSETIGAVGSEQIQAQSAAEFGNQVLRQFSALQFQEPHLELLYLTKDADNEDLKKNRVELVPRRKFRFPYLVQGQLELAVPGTAFENTPPLPQVATKDDNEGLRWMTLELNNLIEETSRVLSNDWERAMDDAGENDF